MQPSQGVDIALLTTGIAGLDNILGGGFPVGRIHLVQGSPGVGKTTLALQFLLEGLKQREKGLYITLSETDLELRQVAASHGWSLDGLHLCDLSNVDHTLQPDEENTLYAPADIELRETMRYLLNEVERLRPTRVVFDSLSEIRLLAQSPTRYRRQLLAIKQFFAGRGCTVLLLDDQSGNSADLQIESIAHGVLKLEALPLQYGPERRRIRIAKMRGRVYRSGHHDFVVATGGLVVFPRLVGSEHRHEVPLESISTGVAQIDKLLGGGLDRGTAALFVGPAGAGKSAVAAQIACSAAARGEKSAIFLFD